MTLEGRATSLRGTAHVAALSAFAADASREGRHDLIIDVLAPVARRSEAPAVLVQWLALAYRAQQQSRDALDAFVAAATLAPNDPKIAAGHATAAYEAGEPSALLFHKARELSPNDPEMLLSAAASLRADGYGDVAEALLVRALDVNMNWVRGHEALATLRWTGGDTSHFARSFASACATAPDDVSLRLAWQRALAQAWNWDGARRVIADGRVVTGARIEFDAAEANIATETGDDALAERLFPGTAVLDDPGTHVAHIRHCLRTGRLDRAEAIATRIKDMPAASAVWPYLSLIWRLRGDPRAAWLDGEPPFVRIFDLPFPPGSLETLAARLRALHNTRHHPAEQSLRGGTQTEGDLLLRVEPELVAVKASILAAVRSYVDALPPHDAGHPLLGTPRSQLLFAGSWSVRLQSQGFHVVHTHPFGWISSALYVALPEAMGTAPAGWLQLGAPPPDLRLAMPPYTEIEPKPGRLVLFPSTMWHGTVPFDDGERLTIAFDIAPPTR